MLILSHSGSMCAGSGAKGKVRLANNPLSLVRQGAPSQVRFVSRGSNVSERMGENNLTLCTGTADQNRPDPAGTSTHLKPQKGWDNWGCFPLTHLRGDVDHAKNNEARTKEVPLKMF